MSQQSALDARTIALSALAIVAFVIVGVGVAVFGAPDEPTSVLANAPSTTSTSAAPTTSITSTTTTTEPEVPEVLEVTFEPFPGLGFTRQRTWSYDRGSRTLRNEVLFTSALDELLVAHTEVFAPSLVDLGEFEFDPLTDDITFVGDIKNYRFEILTTAFLPGVLEWTVVTDDELTLGDLERLAAERTEAEAKIYQTLPAP